MMSTAKEERVMGREQELSALPGWLMLVVLIGVLGGSIYLLLNAIEDRTAVLIIAMIFLMVVTSFCFGGLTVVNPNQAKVVTLFGTYKGTLKAAGFWWVNPLTTRRGLSLRVRNFESDKLKVNDSEGNPIEIAAIVVWKIVETFEAAFNVDDYEHFVHVQSESAVRMLA